MSWRNSSANLSFDIRKIDPETFRAIAVKITDAQKPTIDGKPTHGGVRPTLRTVGNA